MYSPSDLNAEIEKTIRERIDAGQIVRKDWISHEILAAHPLPDFDDADFTECCRRVAVADAVNKVNRRFKEDPETVSDGQLPLPGYRYLQKAYPVERQGERLLVPLLQLTVGEIRDKITFYREMSSGCAGHARELERFIGISVAAAD